MARAYRLRMRGAIVSALGIVVLLGTPLLAQADQGKWWKPKEGDRRVEQRDRNGQGPRDPGSRGGREGRSWSGRGNRGPGGPAWGGPGVRYRGPQGGIIDRDRRPVSRGSWGGGAAWRGVPIRRDVIRIRDRRYGGGFFRARRIYAAPRFYGRFVYVRPVRFFIGADAFIGGVGIHARIARPHYIYGCNFCDEQFDSYDAYAAHVERCPYRPDGYGISVSNWDDGSDSSWDGPYSTDEGGYDGAYRSDDRGQDGGGYDPHVRAQDDNGSGGDNGYDDNGPDNGQDNGVYHHE